MNTTLDKIDNFLEKMDMEIDPRIIEMSKVGGKEYDSFFKEMLKKWKIKSYKDLPKNKQGKFFDEVDAKWSSKIEKGKTSKKYKKGQSSVD